jgi:Fur family ferric uptake transcriptional regulator
MPAPIRSTRQREAIREVIRRADRPLSPREILDRTQRELANISLATVYRTVRTLLEQHEITQVDLPGESPRYEPAGKGHHHHFHCRACGRAFDLTGCPGPLDAYAPDGYEVDGHELTLTGRCPACVAADRPAMQTPPNA